MAEEDDWQKLPSEQKVAHKNWKARLAGYTELQKLFNGLDEKSPEFAKYGPQLKGFIADANAAAQEKGVDAAVAFLNNSAQGVVTKCAAEVISATIVKGLAATKPKTREQAQEIIMLMIEREKHEMVMEEFMTALENKQPKFVATCALTLRDALKNFGPKVINIKSVLKSAPRLLEDRDPTVRDAGKQLIVELVIWVGRAAIKPNLQSLKPVQLQELDAEFDKIEAQNTQPVPTRFTLTEQKKRMTAGVVGETSATGSAGPVGGAVAGAPVETRVIDAWDLADPEEIISKYPVDWHEKLESKKWQERKEALEPFEKLVSAVRLKPGEYGDLCHALINVIKKDANIVVVQLAAKIITGLAHGLRKNYSAYAHASLEALLERSKEKKQSLTQAFREASDAIFVSTNLDAMSEHVLPFLSNKTPIVRSETAAFLDRCFTSSRGPRLSGNKKIVKIYVAPLLTLVGDQVGEVREAAFETLGCLHAFAGEKTVEPLLADVDQIRLAKIHEVSQKRLATAPSQGAAVVETAPSVSEPPKPVPVKRPPGVRPSTAGAGSSPNAPSATSSSYGDAVDAGPVPAVKRPPSKSAPAGGRKPGKNASKGKVFEESEISEESAVYECSNLFGGEEIVKLLQSSNWKERQEAVDKILSTLKATSPENIPVQAVIRLLAAKSGLRDNNLPVMKLKLDIVSFVSSGALGPRFSKTSAFACLNDIIDRIGDAKNGSVVQKLLTDMADSCDAVGPEFLVPYVLSQAMSSKSPKTHQEALNWFSTVVNDFGLRFQLKEVVPTVRLGLSSANGQVRTAAITAFGRLYLLTGPTLRTLLEDEKPALLQLIDAEFERVKDEPPPKPSRGIRKLGVITEGDDADSNGDDQAAASAAAAETALEDLLPRVDIGSKLQGELMEQLDDKTSYKIRKEAIDKVLEVIKEAKLIYPNLGDLPAILVKRLKEANKVLVQSALTVCEQLATSMGKKTSEHISVLGPAILISFGDNKPQIRQQAINCMGIWVDQCGGNLAPFFENLLFSAALQTGNPILRAELLTWLSKRLPPNYSKLPKDDLIASIPFLLSALEDRSVEVRKAGQDALLPFMIHTGYEPFAKAVEALKPASKDQLTPLIDKAKSEMPAPPVKSQPTMDRGQTIVKKTVAKKMASAGPTHSGAEPTKSLGSPTERKPVSPPKAGVSKSANSPLRGRAMSALTLNNSTAAAVANPSASVAVNATSEEPIAALFDERTSIPAAKDARIREESKLKLLKWNFSQPSKEYLDQLRRQITTANVSPILTESLFSSDVRQHIRAIDQMAAYAERKPVVVFSNIDLIFKWLTLRFFDNNTTLHIRAFRFLLGLLPLFGAAKLRLSDADISCFMPYLLVKVGDPKDNIRRDVHAIVRAMCDVYPVHKLVPWIIDGLKSRNAKQRAECLDQLQTFFNDFDLAIAGCDQAALISILRSIAGQVADRDGSVRNSALSCLVVAAGRQGFGAEGILQHTAPVMAPKERAMLEERLRRTCPGAASFDADLPSARAATQGTPTVPPTLAGSATLTRPARASATPVAQSVDTAMTGRGMMSTPGTVQIAANAGSKTITRRHSSSTRPAPRVQPQQFQAPPSAEPVSATPEIAPSSGTGSATNSATPSPVRTSVQNQAPQAPPPCRFEDPFGQNWAPPVLPAPLPPFTSADEFLNEPPLIMPTRNVDPNTLPASVNMVPAILARLNSAGLSVASAEMLTPLVHLSLTAANRRINLEPHCDPVVSTLTSLLRRICDALSPGSVPDLYRTEVNYYQTLGTLSQHLEDIHTKLFQAKSPFAQKISLRILRDHLSLLTNQISAFNVYLTPINEQRKNGVDPMSSPHYEAHFEAQAGLLQRLVGILKSVVRSANAGTLFVVLIELLQECVQKQNVAGESAINTGVKDLIHKAMWNITRHIEDRHLEIQDSACNWEAIVGAAHRFFVAFPVNFWVGQDSVPARTVRTVFNAAIVHLDLGKHILSCYEKVFPENYSQAQLYGWLLNCLQKHNASSLNGSSHKDQNGNSASSQKENGAGGIIGSPGYDTGVSSDFSQMKIN